MSQYLQVLALKPFKPGLLEVLPSELLPSELLEVLLCEQ